MPPKFKFKDCWCAPYDAVCSCYEKAQYEYLKEQLQLLVNQRYGGDDTRDAIKELLKEVEKPYEEAKVSNTLTLDALHK